MPVTAVLTDDGREYLNDCIVNGTAPSFPKFMMGSGGVGHTPVESDTDLQTPIVLNFTDLVITKVSARVFQFVAHLPLLAGFTGHVSEIGVFTDTGKLFVYGVFDDHIKNDTDEAYLTWQTELTTP
jgi:hypothetical protein